MNKIKEVFDLLGRWRQLPKYQLERRLDIFFALYLPEILGMESVIKHNNIFPEFPLKKFDDDNKCSSNNADYAIFVNENGKIKLKLIELKTDMNSIKDDKQIAYYQRVKNPKKGGFKNVLKGIIKIQRKSSQWSKYDVLLKQIEDKGYGIIECEEQKDGKRAIWKIYDENIVDEIEVIYIAPTKSDELNWADKTITFEDIIKILKDKENDEIAKQFIELLEQISKQYVTK